MPPQLAYAVVLFLFGLCVGSFLNVVIYRLPRGVSIVHPGSRCPACGRALSAAENVPVLSWLFQRGRCRRCGRRVSLRYPAVELLNGLLWAAAGWHFAALAYEGAFARIGTLIAVAWFLSTLVAVSFIDWDLTEIPDALNYQGLAVGLAASYLLPGLHFGPSARLWFPAAGARFNGLLAGGLGALLGAGLMGLVLVVGTLAYRHKIEELRKRDPDITTAIGFGDVKLMAFLGAFLGWTGVLLAFALGTLLGAVVGLVQKVRTGESLMPYGPYLCAGAACALFFREPLLRAVGAYFARPEALGG